MHKLVVAAQAVGLGVLLAGCSIGPQPQDPAVSAAKGLNLVFERVCMPVILDGQDFGALVRAHMMVAMAPATNATGRSGQTYRLGLTGVSATLWEDGSCTAGSQLGDSEQLRAQVLASLGKRGHVMTRGVSRRPHTDGGVTTAYCSSDPAPLVLGVETPAPRSSATHSMIVTLYRDRITEGASDLCLRPKGI
jgi:hypothetical protein